jgi:hypothetical protein
LNDIKGDVATFGLSGPRGVVSAVLHIEGVMSAKAYFPDLRILQQLTFECLLVLKHSLKLVEHKDIFFVKAQVRVPDKRDLIVYDNTHDNEHSRGNELDYDQHFPESSA